MRYQKKVSQRYDDPLTRISWQNFEHLLAVYFAGQGYRVEHVGTGGSNTPFDGGIDLKLYRDDQYLIVQCKHWNVFQVTHNPVHELLGVMLTQQATGAIVITSGEFTRAAKLAATHEPRVTLIDGAKLRDMLGPIAGMFVPTGAGDVNTRSGEGFARAAARPANFRRGRRRRARNPLPGLAFAIVVGVIVYAVSMHTMTGLAPKPVVQPASIHLPTPSFAPAAAMTPIGTAIAAVMPTTPASIDQVTHMTAAQRREWQRKNDEAMKILEKTTPALVR